jgi:hypothetical protein
VHPNILPNDKVTKEVLNVLRVKTLYERMILEVGHIRRSFSISKDTEFGRKQFLLFKKIAVRCKQENIRVQDFMTIMFTLRFSGRVAWKYPYLSYLASDSAFSTYHDRRRFVKRVFGGSETVIDLYSPFNYEGQFVNCFYNGFPLLHAAYERVGLKVLGETEYLMTLFFSFGEVFSPAFCVTHSRFHSAQEVIEDKEFIQYMRTLAKDVLYKIASDSGYLAQLSSARTMVEAREHKQALLAYSSYKEWEKVWELMK